MRGDTGEDERHTVRNDSTPAAGLTGGRFSAEILPLDRSFFKESAMSAFLLAYLTCVSVAFIMLAGCCTAAKHDPVLRRKLLEPRRFAASVAFAAFQPWLAAPLFAAAMIMSALDMRIPGVHGRRE
jgi:hypothetical protein